MGVGYEFHNAIDNLEGVVVASRGKFRARHQLYVRYVFENLADHGHLARALCALLEAFTAYERPIYKNLNRNDFLLFKLVINHNFLSAIFKEDCSAILSIFSSFEKAFEDDGLFWLQYGLALDDAGKPVESYEKLKTALVAYEHPHTIHALAQQELKLALITDSQSEALNLLQLAKNRLISIESNPAYFPDNYPIVTLSNYHYRIAVKHLGSDAASKIAANYANELDRLYRSRHDEKLREAWIKMAGFAKAVV